MNLDANLDFAKFVENLFKSQPSVRYFAKLSESSEWVEINEAGYHFHLEYRWRMPIKLAVVEGR